MIYFCADDYGISKTSNERIEYCLKNGVLNKVSVLPNGEIEDFKKRLLKDGARLSLHINLVEGYPLADADELDLIVTESGKFKYSFIGLFFLSLTGKRRELEKELYTEIKRQIDFWKKECGEGVLMSIDSHQHTHMIPLVFKTLLRVIKDSGIEVDNLRIPAEPLAPYIMTPSLYMSYGIKGIIKQWLLGFLGLINRKELKSSGLNFAYFMGVMFSGRITENKIRKLLPKYIKLAEKNGKDIEIALHPGCSQKKESLIDGSRPDFERFYFSPWRSAEFDTLLNFKFE